MNDVPIPLHRVTHDQVLERLVTDACYLLSLQAEGELSQEEYQRWRDRWLTEAGQILQDDEVSYEAV